MHFHATSAVLGSLSLLLASLSSAQTVFTLEADTGNLVGGQGCAITFNDPNCCHCSDTIPLTDSFTCEQIDQNAGDGTNGGHVGPLSTCGGGILDVYFIGDGNPQVTLSVGSDCALGCYMPLNAGASCFVGP